MEEKSINKDTIVQYVLNKGIQLHRGAEEDTGFDQTGF